MLAYGALALMLLGVDPVAGVIYAVMLTAYHPRREAAIGLFLLAMAITLVTQFIRRLNGGDTE